MLIFFYRSVIKANFWKMNATCFVYLGLCWRGIGEDSRFSPQTLPLKPA